MKTDERQDALESFQAKCKEHGLKVTPQRIAIYEKLIEAENHPSTEEVYEAVAMHFPHISFDTVNRTLHTFADIGLVRVVEGFGSPLRFDSNLRNHHHAHCIKCGAILDFYSDDYDALAVPKDIKRRFKILNKRVILNGICQKCKDN